MKRGLAAATAVGLMVALPASASARQYKAFAGDPIKAPKSAPAGTALNQFFPHKLRIHQGDTVKYTSGGFHNVSVLGKGQAFPGPIVPDPAGGKYAGINDPQGNPFFYNGLGKFVYNPVVFGAAGDKNVTKGETGESSGILIGPKGPVPTTLKFSATGTVKVLCTLHPGMSQTVKVLKKKAKGADKPASAGVRAVKEARKLFKAAAKAAREPVPANTVYAGQERKQATVLAFKPAAASVSVGGSLTFKNMSPSEVHNMVFIGTKTGDKATAEAFGDAHQTETDLFPLGPPGAPNQAMPDLIYGSEAPTTPPAGFTYSGDEFGIGYLQTPAMDTVAVTPPPGEEAVTFTKAGTYHYYCAIHGKSMSGTVTVK